MGVVLLQLMAIGVELEEIAEKYLAGFRPSLKNWGKNSVVWQEEVRLA